MISICLCLKCSETVWKTRTKKKLSGKYLILSITTGWCPRLLLVAFWLKAENVSRSCLLFSSSAKVNEESGTYFLVIVIPSVLYILVVISWPTLTVMTAVLWSPDSDFFHHFRLISPDLHCNECPQNDSSRHWMRSGVSVPSGLNIFSSLVTQKELWAEKKNTIPSSSDALMWLL